MRTHGQRRKQTPKTPKTPIRASTLINLLRAVLLERGIAVAKGRRHLEEHLKLMLADDAEPPATLSPRTRLLIEDMRLEWGELDHALPRSAPSS